jgi:hypothetical protein
MPSEPPRETILRVFYLFSLMPTWRFWWRISHALDGKQPREHEFFWFGKRNCEHTESINVKGGQEKTFRTRDNSDSKSVKNRDNGRGDVAERSLAVDVWLDELMPDHGKKKLR